jgi:hypothetical protein
MRFSLFLLVGKERKTERGVITSSNVLTSKIFVTFTKPVQVNPSPTLGN